MFNWRLKKPDSGTLEAIFIAPSAGQPMQSVESVMAQEDMGLEGDRYYLEQGFWKATDACQVTLITTTDLERAEVRLRRVLPGHHRRNLVVSGISASALKGRKFRIGLVEFAWQKPRPPCAYLDRTEGAGMARGLGKQSGMCIRVTTSGVIRVGDSIEIL